MAGKHAAAFEKQEPPAVDWDDDKSHPMISQCRHAAISTVSMVVVLVLSGIARVKNIRIE